MWQEVIGSILIIVLLYVINPRDWHTSLSRLANPKGFGIELSLSTTTVLPTEQSDSVLVHNDDSPAESEPVTTSPIVIALPRMSLKDFKSLERLAMGVDPRSYLWMLDSGKEDPAVFRKRESIPEGFLENAILFSTEELSEELISKVLDSPDNLPQDKMRHMKAVLRESLNEVLNTPTIS